MSILVRRSFAAFGGSCAPGTVSCINTNQLAAHSATCLRVLEGSARYDMATQKTSPRDGMHVSRYS